MARYVSTYACNIASPSPTPNWMYENDNIVDFDEMMDDVYKWSFANNKYFVRHTRTYNILLIGKTRTGKTTVARVLKSPCYIPPDAKFHSETKEVIIHSFSTASVHKDIIHCFNIIDPPGMLDTFKTQRRSMTNEQIKRSVEKCMENDITNVHLFAFVISLQKNVDIEEISSMIFAKDHYPFLHNYMCLIVTHCEETTGQQRKAKLDEFFQSDKIIKHNLRELFGQRIFFMGSLRPELVTYPNQQSVRQQIRNVHDMRDTLLDYIINLDIADCFNIHHVNLANDCSIL